METRRELQQLSLAQLKALVEKFQLPTNRRKNTIIDRIYRQRRQAARDNTENTRSHSESRNRGLSCTPTRLQVQLQATPLLSLPTPQHPLLSPINLTSLPPPTLTHLLLGCHAVMAKVDVKNAFCL